jgi:hypothetical protein
MTRVKDRTRPIRVFVVSIGLGIALGSISASWERQLRTRKHPARCTSPSGWRTARKDDTQYGCQHCAVLSLRRCGPELPSIWPSVHVGVGAASMSIIGRWMAIADGRRMAAAGEALRRGLAKIRMTILNRRIRRSRPEAVKVSMQCSAVPVPLMGVCTTGNPRILLDGIRE